MDGVRPCVLRPSILVLTFLGVLHAQTPTIGTIDFYGLRKVPVEKVRKSLGVKEGDPLPASKRDVEERMEKLPGVVQASLQAACCEDGKTILYAGIEEKGAHHFDYHKVPDEDVKLPEEIHATYAAFLSAAAVAGHVGAVSEDLSQGHSLLNDPEARALQEKFLGLAETNQATLQKVLRTSADDEQRAMAAYVIGYAPDKSQVVNDLQYALQDPDETVRSNAMRSLGAFAVLAAKDPKAGMKISPTWFVELLNSVVWTDRNNAAVVLVNLTETRDPGVISLLKERALPALAEMAMWKHLPHALPAYILIGRIAGLPEKEIQDTWSAGNRQSVVGKILKAKN